MDNLDHIEFEFAKQWVSPKLKKVDLEAVTKAYPAFGDDGQGGGVLS